MIPYDKCQLANAVPGSPIEFQDGIVNFYETVIYDPGEGWFRRNRDPVKIITFRVHPNRMYVDRYHWMWVQERKKIGLSRNAQWRRNYPANIDRIWAWMHSHYWTMQEKGFPKQKRWLEMIDWEEYDRQTEEWIKSGLKRAQWKINRKTLKVTRV